MTEMKMTEATLNETQMGYLGGMAKCHEANTGRLPKTMKELSDHWHDMSDHVVVFEHTDKNGRHHPAETVLEVDAPDHMLQCNWLYDLERRSDADALLAEAIKVAADEVRDDTDEPAF
jgi:hypothetical protein